MLLKTVLLVFTLSFICGNVFAQQNPPVDSNKIYRDIEVYAKKSKFTKFLYRLVFIPIPQAAGPEKKNKKTHVKKAIEKPYSSFEGKIIRNITIETLDPLGRSIYDTARSRTNFLINAGNKIHIKSQHITIRNLLLIHSNQPFDSLKVRESERLIRSQSYVHDVKFFITETSKKSDSVDIFIRELDNWSIIPSGSGSPSRFRIDLSEKNFLGFGHEFQNGIGWFHTTGRYEYDGQYVIPNIRNTYISTTASYSLDQYKYFTKSLSFDRPFYSALSKWAAGASFSQRFYEDSIRYLNTPYFTRTFKYYTHDYWVARAWQLVRGSSVDVRSTNLILSQRLFRLHYLEQPTERLDSSHSFSNETFYFTGIGIARQKYIQEKYVFNYGITEDVPIGNVYNLTAGYQVRNNVGRFYAAIRFAFGNYYDWGYLSSDVEYASFFHSGQAEQGLFTSSLNYFTGLFEIGRWKFRQFAKPQLTIGINRLPNENITISEGYSIRGFGGASITGTSKIALTLQTQSYSPWRVLGFRFGPYLISSFEMFGDKDTGFKRSKLYSRFALGILIKNEYLVFNLLQVSVVFYPIIPGDAENIFKFNSGKTRDFGFHNFVIGKPDIVKFQ